MEQDVREIRYALLGTPHNLVEKGDYSADLVIHRVVINGEQATYLYAGMVIEGEYVRKELAIGNIEMTWASFLKLLPDYINVMTDNNYAVYKDFKLRLEVLSRQDKAKLRFDKTFDLLVTGASPFKKELLCISSF